MSHTRDPSIHQWEANWRVQRSWEEPTNSRGLSPLTSDKRMIAGIPLWEASSAVRPSASSVRVPPLSLELGGSCVNCRLGGNLGAVLGFGALAAVTLGVFDYTGGRLSGYQKWADDEYENKMQMRKNRRRDINETIAELGEGRGLCRCPTVNKAPCSPVSRNLRSGVRGEKETENQGGLRNRCEPDQAIKGLYRTLPLIFFRVLCIGAKQWIRVGFLECLSLHLHPRKPAKVQYL